MLDAGASFTTFATEFLQTNKVDDELRGDSAGARSVPGVAAERKIQPGVDEWIGAERKFISNRLKTEIFNQAFGVEKGDEVEAQRDPVIIRRRLEAMARA